MEKNAQTSISQPNGREMGLPKSFAPFSQPNLDNRGAAASHEATQEEEGDLFSFQEENADFDNVQEENADFDHVQEENADFDNVQGEENGEVRDVEAMFATYKELGGELERNLKAMESKNTVLASILSQTSKECEFLRQQKDLQQKSLLELQLKAENLNSAKMALLEESVQERDLKMKILNQEFQTAFSNDAYIRDTLLKMNEILSSDKADFERLMSSLVSESEEAKKAGKSYIQKMRELLYSYETENQSLTHSIQEIDEELESTIELFKNNKEIQLTKLKMIDDHKLTLESIVEKIQKNHEEIEEYKKKIVQLELGVTSLNSSYEEQSAEHKELLAQKQHELEKQCNKVVEIQQLLVRKEIEFDDLVEENNRHLAQIEIIMSEKAESLKEIKIISAKVDELKVSLDKDKRLCREMEELSRELTLLDQQEIDLRKAIENENLMAKEKTEELEVLLGEIAQVEKEEDEINEKSARLKSDNIELKERIEYYEKELELASASYENAQKESDKLIKLENQLKNLEDDLKNEQEINSTLNSNIETLNQQISSTKQEEEQLDIEIAQITKNIETKSEQIRSSKESFHLVQEMLEDVEEEMLELKNHEYYDCNVEEMEMELEEIQKNIEALSNDDESTSIAKPHLQEIDKINEQISKLKQATDEYLKKKEETSKRYKNGAKMFKSELVFKKSATDRAFNKLLTKVKTGLDFYEELIEVYKLVQNVSLSQGKEDKKFSRLFNSLHQQLSNPISQMAQHLGMKGINLQSPTYQMYKQVFDTFKAKSLSTMTIQSRPLKDVHEDVIEIASCLFGKLKSNPKIASPTPCESIVSSTSSMTP